MKKILLDNTVGITPRMTEYENQINIPLWRLTTPRMIEI